jgi:hypothetical protein
MTTSKIIWQKKARAEQTIKPFQEGEEVVGQMPPEGRKNRN